MVDSPTDCVGGQSAARQLHVKGFNGEDIGVFNYDGPVNQPRQVTFLDDDSNVSGTGSKVSGATTKRRNRSPLPCAYWTTKLAPHLAMLGNLDGRDLRNAEFAIERERTAGTEKNERDRLQVHLHKLGLLSVLQEKKIYNATDDQLRLVSDITPV